VTTDTRVPSAATAIRITALHATRGLNYWSRRPVIRMDVAVGEYDEISSADAEDFTERLLAVLPGLRDHECSIGARGGFALRLKRGTYAPHIIEHVALELQTMAGHDVSYGKTRGGDESGEYTIVFEHRHEQVGLRAGAAALDIVQRAFDGTLESVDTVIAELRAMEQASDTPPLDVSVFCGVTGGAYRGETIAETRARLAEVLGERDLIVDVSPAYLLQAGLPYARSEYAVVLDTALTDVPPRYQEARAARKLVSILADAVWRGGTVICPSHEWTVQDYAREQDCRVAIFSTDDTVSTKDQEVASAVAQIRDGRIVLDRFGKSHDAGPVDETRPVAAQVAAALTAYLVRHERGLIDAG